MAEPRNVVTAAPPDLLALDSYDYVLPSDLIAQNPVEPRDSSRLLVVDRVSGTLDHRVFRDIAAYLRPGDLLVANDTRVIPARLRGQRAETGGQVEIFLLKRLEADLWECLVKPGRRLHPGAVVVFANSPLRASIEQHTHDGERVVRFSLAAPNNITAETVESILRIVGETPLPPYIHDHSSSAERYQTIYGRHDGSVAAPTAGLHFTDTLLASLRSSGVNVGFVTLHVGAGTFKTVQSERITDHRMHAEHAFLSADLAEQINRTRATGRRVIAVGTTSLRTLESAVDPGGFARPFNGETDIFIYPGYRFRVVDALITNFHLPKSTLMMLVSAFAGYELTRKAYAEAINDNYRFYSFGDAMLII